MKAASLILVVLCFPALLSPQQIVPMDIPAPAAHPGVKLFTLNERDLHLFQLRAFAWGLEIGSGPACEDHPGGTKEYCDSIKVHIEPEQGSDSETIRLHAYYRVDGTKLDEIRKTTASVVCLYLQGVAKTKAPAWMKFERRDNGDAVEALK